MTSPLLLHTHTHTHTYTVVSVHKTATVLWLVVRCSLLVSTKTKQRPKTLSKKVEWSQPVFGGEKGHAPLPNVFLRGDKLPLLRMYKPPPAPPLPLQLGAWPKTAQTNRCWKPSIERKTMLGPGGAPADMQKLLSHAPRTSSSRGTSDSHPLPVSTPCRSFFLHRPMRSRLRFRRRRRAR